MAKKKKKWIQNAIKKPGALTATAKRLGYMTKGGNIDLARMSKAKNLSPTTKKRVALAKTLKKMSKKRKRG